MPPSAPLNVPNAMLGRHLGRKPPTDEMRKKALPLRPFVKLIGRPVPTTDDYASKAQSCLTKMMNNDTEGCCVATALAKLLGVMASYRPGGSTIVATDREVSAWYHAVGGPGDNGLYSPDALDYLRDKGFKIGNVVHKIEGYASVDPTDAALLDAAFHWFGGLYYGVSLTRQQYMHAEDSDTWDLDGTPVVGGHAIPFTKRAADQGQLATWAKQPKAKRRLMESPQWADEVYVLFGPDWFNEEGLDVNGVNVQALRDALAAIKSGGTPVIPDDPNPPGPPPSPPGGGGAITLQGTVNMFGQMLPLAATGTLTPEAVADILGQRGANPWAVFQDFMQLWSDAKARNWVAIAADVAKLLADLGITLSGQEAGELAKAIEAGILKHALK